MGSQSTHSLAGIASYHHLTGKSIARRRLSFVGVGTVLIILYIYFFTWPELSVPTKTLSSQSLSPDLEEIPARIWQNYFATTKIDAFLPLIQSWITKNQDFAYTLISNDGANAFARKHYADRPEILQAFLDLHFPILRSDLLRYMVLESEGGVYSDLDTNALKPVSEWVPEASKTKVHAIIGIEYDQLDGEPYIGMDERLQFCQWTIAASRGHPIMRRAVQNVVEALHSAAEKQHISIAQLELTDNDVVKVSGPVIWTRAIMRTLSEATGTIVDYRNFTGMEEPRLFGDVLILPIDGFGTGQPHSNASTDEGGDAYVRHMWKGSWKHHWNN